MSLLFRQLFDTTGSSTYTYLLASEGVGVLIDPVLENVDRDIKLAEELNVKLSLVLNTHCHADHTTGSGEIKKRQPDVRVSAALLCSDCLLVLLF